MGIFGFGKKKTEPELLATQNGTIVDVTTLDDPVFSGKILGDGFAVEPTESDIYSPVSGKIIDVQNTLHAYGIETDDGLQVLVHIGINTVALNGEGFKSYVKDGQRIKAGDKLANADISLIKEKGYSITTVVLITNMDDVEKINVNYGKCNAGETVALTYGKK